MTIKCALTMKPSVQMSTKWVSDKWWPTELGSERVSGDVDQAGTWEYGKWRNLHGPAPPLPRCPPWLLQGLWRERCTEGAWKEHFVTLRRGVGKAGPRASQSCAPRRETSVTAGPLLPWEEFANLDPDPNASRKRS